MHELPPLAGLWPSGETARRLSVAVSTLHDLRRKGALTAVESPLGYLFVPEEVARFAATFHKRECFGARSTAP